MSAVSSLQFLKNRFFDDALEEEEDFEEEPPAKLVPLGLPVCLVNFKG